MHAVALLHPVVRLVPVDVRRVLLHVGRARHVVPEHDRPVGVGEVADPVLGASVPALLADLCPQRVGRDGPQLFVLVPEQNRQPRRLVVKGRGDGEDRRLRQLDNGAVGNRRLWLEAADGAPLLGRLGETHCDDWRCHCETGDTG